MRARRDWPLTLNYDYVASGSGATQTTSVSQTKGASGSIGDVPWSLLNTVQSSDFLTITPSGFTPSNGKSRQQYKLRNQEGYRCYDETLKSLNYAIVSRMNGC
jgi:hypothetical protein